MMKGRKLILAFACVLVLIASLISTLIPLPQPSSAEPWCDRLAADIQALKDKADDEGRVAVVIKLQEPSLLGVKQAQVLEELKVQTGQSQKRVLGLLDRKDVVILNTFWLTNAVLAEVPVSLLDQIAALPEVESLFENFAITIPEPTEEEIRHTILGDSPDVTWGLEKIRAPEVWDIGVSGSGVRVAVLDTGVDISHPDLAGKMWTDDPNDPTYPGGWIYFDGYGNVVVGATPFDTHGHGTHCSGTVLGGDTSGIAIGVAPDAWLMHGLILPGGWGTFAMAIAGMQWTIAPFDQHGNPAGEPADVVSMSWGWWDYNSEFIEPINNMRAAGVVPVVANGNSGDESSASPGNVYESFGIGATDINDNVAGFSSGQVIDWPESHPEPYIKPDFSAPGVDIYSAMPIGGYYSWEGTSMAAPHVAGTVALMIEANPTLTVDEIYEILKDTAVWYDHYYDERPCTRYGWGRVDAFEAVSLAALGSGTEGVITDAATTELLEGVKILVHETGQVKYTNDSGYYKFFLPPDSYTLTAGIFGYYEYTTIVDVLEGTFTSCDIVLHPMPTGFIAGVVTDVETGEPIEGATISLLDTHLNTTTNEAGHYYIEAPIGAYDLRAWAWGYRTSVVSGVNVSEGETIVIDLSLEPALALAAVLGDYNSQLAVLLNDNGISAEERAWDIIADIGDYDVVVVNWPDDPGQDTFLEFLDVASDNQVGVVFTSQWPVWEPFGIALLEWYLDDPAGQNSEAFTPGYTVTQPHPIFAGWQLGDEITIFNSGYDSHSWFWDYSGTTIAHVGFEEQGMGGAAVAVSEYGGSTHVLLASLGTHNYINVVHWTEDAKTIFVNAVAFAGGVAAVPCEANLTLSSTSGGTVTSSAWQEMEKYTRPGCDFAFMGIWGSSSTDIYAVGGGSSQYGGTILHFDGNDWHEIFYDDEEFFWDIWGSSASDVFVVGYQGTIMHYDGDSWSYMDSSVSVDLRSIWGTSSTDVFAVGGPGTILHYDGYSWSPMDSGTDMTLLGVWGTSSDNVFAAGDDGTILHYDGSVWSQMNSGSTGFIWDIWGSSSSDVYAVGGFWSPGFMLHYDGASWTQVIDSNPEMALLGVWGFSSSSVFAVGAYDGDVPTAAILHYNGSAWTDMESNSQSLLLDVWGTSPENIFAVGGDPLDDTGGVILNYKAHGAGTVSYECGTIAYITAAPDHPYYEFVEWSGSGVDAGKVADPYSPSTTILMDGDCSVQANFAVVEIHEVWVSCDFDENTPGFGLTLFNTIQAGIDAVTSPGTVYVEPCVYEELITLKDGVAVVGSGADNTIIDGGGNGPVVTAIDVGTSTKLEGFTIRNGSTEEGGGMYTWFSSLAVTDCIFQDNSADDGGGMYIYDGSPTITNCTFLNNSAHSGSGGGIMSTSHASTIITGCTFISNTAEWGGGISDGWYTSVTVQECTFTDNSASLGGGMVNWGGVVIDCTFTGNSAEFGGGLAKSGDSPVTGCTFTGNSAEIGGGIFSFDSSSEITGCVFKDNTAFLYGGAISNERSSPEITGCDFIGNVAEHYGGAMYNYGDSSPIVSNCEFSNNESNGYGGGAVWNQDCSPSFTNCTFSNNLSLKAGTGRGGAMLNVNASPSVTDCVFSNNAAAVCGGAMYNENHSSPVVTGCSFSGSTPDDICNYNNSSTIM